jgi:Arc/MetJ-type ribon-helix-helix transcriptional regulator
MAEKLQIICFKMDSPQLHQIDGLIKDQLYFSRSEVLRVAIRHLLMKISSDPAVSMASLSWNSMYSENGKTKDSVSSKLPPILLKCVDEVVNQGIFQSRSQFIRESIKIFLEDREALHSYVQGSAS